MALRRIWTPTGNYSGGGTKRILVIHTMEGFTGPNGAHDCAVYFQGDVGASSQVCIDNNRGTVWEGVSRANASWTQCNYNGAAVSCEQSGYASWSRSYWLGNRDAQLRNIADWLAEESAHFGIPLTDLSASAAQGGGRGVCYHSELGSAGCGHSDPGAGFPLDVVLDWARGGNTVEPEPEPEPPKQQEVDDDMVAIPPRSKYSGEFGISLPGPFKAMGVFTDASIYPDSTHLRCAFHPQDKSPIQVIEVYSDPAHTKVVVWPAKPFDSVSITRMDDNNVYVVPDFGR
jgi:hypothetical protein